MITLPFIYSDIWSMRSKAKRERRMGAIPRWLECLLSTTFFNACPSHKQAPRSECNMFCLDCSHSSSFCFYCRSNKHHHHHVIQVLSSFLIPSFLLLSSFSIHYWSKTFSLKSAYYSKK